ncbi:MAG: sigma-E processing peptidase SpoIIGA [Clostridiales bacterium]|nr:sigma-E processing peptidase SpoIIGA [Clostridiales bacterium]
MYYKLYIDSVFFIQLVMNMYLLSITGKVLKCTATHGRIFLSALLGAGAICMIILLPVANLRIRLVIGVIPVSMVMIIAAFKLRSLKLILRSSMVMAVCALFFGSAILWLSRQFALSKWLRYGIRSFAFFGFFAYGFIRFLISKLHDDKAQALKEIRIPTKNGDIHMTALLDTGNHLLEPISSAPVCIVSKSAAKLLSDCFLPQKYHAIPYRSIGKKAGILSAYEIPELIIEDTYREIKCRQVIIAICNTEISKDSIYQMILHPKLMEN